MVRKMSDAERIYEAFWNRARVINDLVCELEVSGEATEEKYSAIAGEALDLVWSLVDVLETHAGAEKIKELEKALKVARCEKADLFAENQDLRDQIEELENEIENLRDSMQSVRPRRLFKLKTFAKVEQ